MVRKQIQRFKDRRTYKKLISRRISTIDVATYVFSSETKYESQLIIPRQNVKNLTLCKKSGSWVRVRFFKKIFVFWTSMYLSYFGKITSVSNETRNFGIGIITGAKITKLNNVYISSKPVINSLNIYNHKINVSNSTSEVRSAFYLCVNGADQFQHFIQDFLPILSFIHSFLRNKPELPLIVKKPSGNFKDYEYYFELLGLKNPKIFIDNNDQFVENLFMLDFIPMNAIYCLPKELYSSMFQLVHKNKKYIACETKNLVLFVRKEKTRNFANQNLLIQEFESRSKALGLKPIFLDTSKSNLDYTINVLSNAKYIFGVHGGSIYNMIFAAPESTLIEFITTESTDSLSHMIRSFGINYMPFAIIGSKGSHELEISIEDLDCIFEALSLSSN
jgi:hypothetical protein